jgi:hypothetical protein
MLVAAHFQKIKVMAMSATIADNPLQLYSLGLTLKLFNSTKEFFRWAQENGCYEGKWGWEFNNSQQNLIKIHNSIFHKKGARIAIKELGNLFPDNTIISDAYDMNSNAKQIQKIYEEMENELNYLKEKSKGDVENPLTILLRARQKIELLKIPTLVEMAEDLVEEGNSVVIFVNFNETVKTLSEKLNTKCLIWGSNKDNEREENRMKFMEGKERIIICNIRAGGVGISLHDELGNYPRVSLISPSWSAQDLIQALGRIHRAGSKSPAIQKLVFCAGTVEEDISEKVAKKVKNIHTINDGDL